MNASVPASYFVNVLPGVLGASGTALDLCGLMLTTSTRVPIGTVQSFSTAADVGAFFGLNSNEYTEAGVYFAGFDISTKKPANLLFAQYVWQNSVAPYLRSASLATMTLAQLNAIPAGTLTIVINGISHTSSSINLSGASSFSAAASTIASALGSYDATVTGAIAPATASVTGSISGTTLTVSNVSSGVLVAGAVLSGTGVTATTTILNQLTGTPGAAGTYTVSISQTTLSTTISAAYGTLTVSAVGTGVLAVGQVITGTGVTAGSTITQFLTGSGGTGTYAVNPSQTASSTSISAGPTGVTFDSVTSSFIILGGTPGATGTIGFASGAIATALSMTQALGAVISQGAGLSSPLTFMPGIIADTQNFAAFMTLFEPITSDCVAFAQWTNAQDNRYAYVAWDTDASVTTGVNTQSLGYLIGVNGFNYSGTIPIYESGAYHHAAMVLGFIASVDFDAENGRTTFAYLTQSGIMPDVTSATVLSQLTANDYNCYVAAATAAQGFDFFWNGSVTGPYAWIDSYIDQIWMNANFQLALMELLTNIKAIPYNPTGYGYMAQALSTPIQAAVNFGAIVSGVTLSGTQIAAANAAAGKDISGTLQSRGWYLSIQDPGPTTRQARGTPTSIFFYTDGGSVQQITLSSLDLP